LTDIRFEHLIDILKEEHPPVDTVSEARLMKTTVAIWPDEELTMQEVHDLMYRAGYVIKTRPGSGERVWVLG
jgi:hypothetical protein